MPADREELHDIADELLAASVQEAVGSPDAAPRPGQLRLMHDVLDTMLGSYSTTSKIPGHHAGEAPTGSGKSMAYGVPAFVMAAERRERTVISTESLSLQAQIIDKDAPTIAAAAEKLWGSAPAVAVLKGWSNYTCAVSASDAAKDLLGVKHAKDGADLSAEALADKMHDLAFRLFGDAPGMADEAVARHRLAEAAAQAFAGDGQPLSQDAALDRVKELLSAVHGRPDVKLDEEEKSARLAAFADLVDLQLSIGPRLQYTPTGKVARSRKALATMNTVTVDGADLDRKEFLRLLSWSLRQSAGEHDAAHPGDRHSFDGVMSDQRQWGMVSVSPAECPGADACPFAAQCRPNAGRRRAASADVVVTNHSMLAVQAALGVPVVAGSRSVGLLRHIVMDEAHGIAGTVRAQGARSIGGWRIADVRKAFEHVMDVDSSATSIAAKHVASLAAAADDVSALLDSRLDSLAALIGRKESVYKVSNDADPLEGVADSILGWLSSIKKQVPQPDVVSDTKTQMRLRRTHSKIDALSADVKNAQTWTAGSARWVEPAEEGQQRRGQGSYQRHAVLKVSPVDVSGLLRSNLYEVDVLSTKSDGNEPLYVDVVDADGYREVVRAKDEWQLPESQWSSPGNPHENVAPRYRLSVTALSATLPSGFCAEVGLDTRAKAYPTPFADAYGRSALYVPRAVDKVDVEALKSTYGQSSKLRFDTARHEAWAARHIEELVAANGGSALVLSAKSSSGKVYADRLRAALAGTGVAVHSQWDGIPLRQVTALWREDVGSVLVGTKSLMTGTDAPGETCTLVIVDRIPRAAGNPVDDARTDAIRHRMEIDKWAAAKYTYVSDAALLLAQASGRLIRAASDAGMVAVLDPRLLKVGPFAYQKPAREQYMNALDDFGLRFTTREKALGFLRSGGARAEAV